MAARAAPCAVCRERRLAFAIQNRFGYDRARGISGAQKQDVVMVLHSVYRCSLSAGVQHAGPQQSRDAAASFAAGFFARTNALANFPSTSGAIASTSIPSAVRNCLASATL